MKSLKLPALSLIINLDNILKMSIDSENKVTFNQTTGSDISFYVDDANAFLLQYNNLIDNVDGTVGYYSSASNNPFATIIFTIIPTTFDILTDTIIVNGQGFIPGTVGKLHIEDVSGGADSNGFYMNCTYIDQYNLQATPGGAGDATLGTPPCDVIVYYEDSLGVKSNILPATTPSGTTIILS